MNVYTKKMKVLLLGLMLGCTVAQAQEEGVQVLTLDDCIRIALENNLDIKRAQNNTISAKAFKIQSVANFLPNLSGNLNESINFGYSFDLSAGKQVNVTTYQTFPSVQSTVVLFSGLSNINNLRRRTSEMQAAEEAVESSKVQVRASVLGAYLNVILDRENIRISDERIELLQAQLEREEKRVSVGVSNPESVFNFRSQLANERLSRVQAQNTFQRDKLALIQMLQLDATKDYEIEGVSFDNGDITTEIEPYDEVLSSSLAFSPALKRANFNRQASVYQFKQMSGTRYPTLAAQAQYGSSYSSNGARNPITGENDPDASLRTQFGWNQYKGIGIGLSIPIFTRWQTNANIQAAKVNMYNAELDVKQAQQTITNAIQLVYNDLQAAISTYNAAQENIEALTQAYNFSETRYNAGSTDFYTYLESLNNKNRAEIQLANAKYSIIFRKKILDIYRGIASEN